MKKNDSHRFDGYLNAVSLSISYPNAKMFYKLRHSNEEKSWALLFVDPAVLWEKRCGFCRFNAADKRVPKGSECALVGSERFSEIFDRSLPSEDHHHLRPCDPTDPQAEVLVFEPIETSLIRKVVFFDRKDMDLYGDVVQGAERCVDNSWLDSRYFFLKSQPRSFERSWKKSNAVVPDDEIPF